jgi:hypothetical protein
MVAWYWLLVVAFVTFPAGFCLFALLTVAQVSSDAEAAHEDAGPDLSGLAVSRSGEVVPNETPIARAAREASEVGKPRPEEIEAARLVMARATGNPPDTYSLNCSGIYCHDCPLDKPCRDSAGSMTNAEEAEGARLWLSSHGIDPDAEIEAAR